VPYLVNIIVIFSLPPMRPAYVDQHIVMFSALRTIHSSHHSFFFT